MVPSTGRCGDCPRMRIRLTSDPTESIRKIQKISPMLRSVWRFSRVMGGWPNAKIVGVEPDTILAAKAARIYAGEDTVAVKSCAVGAEDGEIEFFVTANAQNTSIHAPSDSFHDDLHHDGVERTEKLPLKYLDGLLAGCDGPILLHADVQVAELAVLKGAGDHLDDVSVIVIESPNERAYDGTAGFNDIYRFFTAKCFRYEGPLGQLNSKKTGRIRQADSVYVRA
ncbi:MAG: FkbM family methyltransferase [Rhodospirillaceae bacterium]|nr:MAG: FkbM family methyltransferase [Rhodospirillaceae bacterium]